MNKYVSLILSIFFIFNSISIVNADDNKKMIPKILKGHAESALKKYSQNFHERYLIYFRQGAFEWVAYRKNMEEELTSIIEGCNSVNARNKDERNKVMFCGYSDGVIAAKNHEGQLTLEDFGYEKVKLTGVVKFKDKKPFYFISDKKNIFLDYDSFVLKQVKPFGCYSLEGYLGDEGGYGTRIDVFKYHLLVDAASKEKKSACKKR